MAYAYGYSTSIKQLGYLLSVHTFTSEGHDASPFFDIPRVDFDSAYCSEAINGKL
jgi:hypothetical protein